MSESIDLVFVPPSSTEVPDSGKEPIRVVEQTESATNVMILITRPSSNPPTRGDVKPAPESTNNPEGEPLNEIANDSSVPEPELLLIRDEDEWYLPCGTIRDGEGIEEAVRRIVDISVPRTQKINIDGFCVISLENYPSLRRNWVRYAVRCPLLSGEDTNDVRWATPTKIENKEAGLSSYDMVPILDSVKVLQQHAITPNVANCVDLQHLLVSTL